MKKVLRTRTTFRIEWVSGGFDLEYLIYKKIDGPLGFEFQPER